MATPDTKHSIVVRKNFPYRNSSRDFTNRYHFEGDLPADDTAWTTLANNVTDAEQAIYETEVAIIEVVGYDAGTASATNPHGDAVFTLAMDKHGTLVPAAGDHKGPGDAAVLLRYGTPARSTKNHPVYLFNYFHGVYQDSSGPDLLSTPQKTAVEDYATSWITGFSDGSTNRERCGPRGAVATSRLVNSYVHHRDFPA